MPCRLLIALVLVTTLASLLVPALVLADEEPPPAPADGEQPLGVMDFLLSTKYLSMLGVTALGLILLLTRRINIWIRIAVMAATFILFGVGWVFSLHPSPMCATTKLYLFKFTTGRWMPVFIAFALVIFVPSLIGRKLFCGWACPLGAFQELINKIPHRFKIKHPSFTAMNAIRLSLIGLFFLTFHAGRTHIAALAGAVEADPASRIWQIYSAINIYDPINMFELMHWEITTMFWVLISVLVVSSLVLYRPFCYVICPIGGLTWLLERVAPGRVRVDMSACNNCGKCVKVAPCPTLKPLLAGESRNLPDCTSCGECLNICPTDAISFGFAPRKGARNE
jgi:polyferredoxin|nr:4Fe-4S binding protein [Candidatus Krumholzibacteria bacterium]